MKEILPSRQNTRDMYSALGVADDEVRRRVAIYKCAVTRDSKVCLQGVLVLSSWVISELWKWFPPSPHAPPQASANVRQMSAVAPQHRRNQHSTVMGGELRWGRLSWTMPGQMVAVTTTTV
ncbi:hypothetical protein BV22DRAFT_1036812 [Leucogyrophana mollusca]|uniref:Uncharacterized protein n=1 Tax=Leucogyrophana mollusca TaxID=85980 RepID=A0ACB8BC97_9AGAM|nr:hypothetical protein BV22DRAFT_1036812 [Leucogyrophana mollusca]